MTQRLHYTVNELIKKENRLSRNMVRILNFRLFSEITVLHLYVALV